MKNTGVSQRPVSKHGAAIYATYRFLLSRPIFGHTPRKLPRMRAISRFIAVSRAGHAIPSRGLNYNKRKLFSCQEDFRYFFDFFFKSAKSLEDASRLGSFRQNSPDPCKIRQKEESPEALLFSLYLIIYNKESLNRPRPSRCRWCTFCRRWGTHPRCRSAPAACSGS